MKMFICSSSCFSAWCSFFLLNAIGIFNILSTLPWKLKVSMLKYNGIIKMVHTFCTLYNKFLKSYDQSHSGLTPRVPIHFHYTASLDIPSLHSLSLYVEIFEKKKSPSWRKETRTSYTSYRYGLWVNVKINGWTSVSRIYQESSATLYSEPSVGLWIVWTACRDDSLRQKLRHEPLTGGESGRRRSTAERSRTEPKSSVYPLFTLPQHGALQFNPDSLLLTAGLKPREGRWAASQLELDAVSPRSPRPLTSLGCPNLPAPDKLPPRHARTHLWVLECQRCSGGIKLFN